MLRTLFILLCHLQPPHRSFISQHLDPACPLPGHVSLCTPASAHAAQIKVLLPSLVRVQNGTAFVKPFFNCWLPLKLPPQVKLASPLCDSMAICLYLCDSTFHVHCCNDRLYVCLPDEPVGAFKAGIASYSSLYPAPTASRKSINGV